MAKAPAPEFVRLCGAQVDILPRAEHEEQIGCFQGCVGKMRRVDRSNFGRASGMRLLRSCPTALLASGGTMPRIVARAKSRLLSLDYGNSASGRNTRYGSRAAMQSRATTRRV
ncbi:MULTISPECIES: hypothetical protein [unclassified Bradyrhizobium]